MSNQLNLTHFKLISVIIPSPPVLLEKFELKFLVKKSCITGNFESGSIEVIISISCNFMPLLMHTILISLLLLVQSMCLAQPTVINYFTMFFWQSKLKFNIQIEVLTKDIVQLKIFHESKMLWINLVIRVSFGPNYSKITCQIEPRRLRPSMMFDRRNNSSRWYCKNE